MSLLPPLSSYCGADGVDDWPPARWREELDGTSVLVFIHDVFLIALSRGHIGISDVAVLVVDECHHAVGNHPYYRIMEHHYHRAKRAGLPVPRVLGLSASLVIRAVRVAQFRAERAQLERTMDAAVETAEELQLAQFVSSASERIVLFPSRGPEIACSDLGGVVGTAMQQLAAVHWRAADTIIADPALDANSKQTSLDSLKKDYKYFSNDVFGTVSALQELGLYSVVRMQRPLEQELARKLVRDGDWYDPAVKAEMGGIAGQRLQEVAALAGLQMLDWRGGEPERALAFSSPKVAVLAAELRARAAGGQMRCIVFVQRQLVAQALALLLASLELPGVTGVDYAFSGSRGRNVKDAGDRAEISSIKRRLRGVLMRFRNGDINVLVSTSVVEEGLDIPSCNLVIKFDFPTTFRSYIQSKGRARKEGSDYLLLVEEGDVAKEASYREWQAVYRMSMEECHARQQPEDAGEAEGEEEEFYSLGTARISGSQAQVVINQYLQKIPVDSFTRLTAAWTVARPRPQPQVAFKRASKPS
jgi:endoribonuclease Dicer